MIATDEAAYTSERRHGPATNLAMPVEGGRTFAVPKPRMFERPAARRAVAWTAFAVALAASLAYGRETNLFACTVALPAIAAAAYFGGWRLGALATAATLVLGIALPWRPWSAFGGLNAWESLRLFGFAVSGLLFCGLAELQHQHEGALLRAARERQVLVERLGASNAAKDEFLSLVSHELRTPLTQIGGNAEVLVRLDGALDDRSRRVALQDIVGSSNRLNRIIDDMLVLASADHGATLELEPLRPERIARKLAEERSAAFGRAVHASVVAYEGYALADPGAFRQVLENLLNNAIKYSPHGSPVEIATSGADGEVLVSVLDRGMGIREDEAGAMFAPFYRTEAAASRAAGMGLGLAVCKRLADAMNARIWTEARDGGGATFTIALPKAPDEDDLA